MSEPGGPTTIGIVDDHALFREGLREILWAHDDFAVVGEAGDSVEALTMVAGERPDVLLLDIEIPGRGVLDTVAQVRAMSPGTKIIVLSMYDGPQLLSRLLAAGIHGYLLKSVHREEVISAIRSVVNDPDRLVLAVSRDSLAQVNGASSDVLTDKERQVLEFAAQALSNHQIATRLGLTEATVKRHLRNIFVKLGAVSRIDAVNKAVAASLITSQRDPGAGPQGFV
ncbi:MULTISPECIES: response regulator transcription factor [Streptosporangium]|uniref:DNA-binding NarL/FixJ family response regulator n=1 Tax=Streptosporangium brasiliense TaxID=47480 RepID=A0ABT9QWN7_9ACTN|nr:response regulator transcription factor [Streptosporangium brasiliense]MDP9861393.1 DNA-binding NarL/FixJ family response regulator [Streptosporangium brasiliense]